MKTSNFKKSILTLMIIAAFVVVGNTTYAQADVNSNSGQHQKLTPEQRATRKTDKLNKKLNLTSSQYSSIYNSILSAEQQIQTLRGSTTDKASLKDQIKKININTNESIRNYLTPDQQKSFKGWRSKKDKYGTKKIKGNHKKNGKLGPPVQK